MRSRFHPRILIILVALPLIFMTSCWKKQDHDITAPPTPVYTISGHVRDSFTRAPLEGVPVMIPGSGQDTTDATGFYSIFPVEGGKNHVLMAEFPGYAPLEKRLTLSYADREVDFDMGFLIDGGARIASPACLDPDSANKWFPETDDYTATARQALNTPRYQPTGLILVHGKFWTVGIRQTYHFQRDADITAVDSLSTDGIFLGAFDPTNPIMKMEVDNIVIPRGEVPRGLVWDGSHFWMSTFWHIWKLDAQGSVIDKIDAPMHPTSLNVPTTFSDLTWNGTRLFGVTPELLMALGARFNITEHANLTGEIMRGIASAQGSLWTVTIEGHLNRHPVDSEYQIQGYFQVLEPLDKVRGMVWDGRRFWMAFGDRGYVQAYSSPEI